MGYYLNTLNAKQLFPNNILNICGHTIKIDIDDNLLQSVYLPIADKISQQYNQHNMGRQIFGMSGPSGSGKSVLAAILQQIFKANLPFRFVNVAMDGFHHHNDFLLAQPAPQGNETGTLKDFKGRYDTYDTKLLWEKLVQFKSGSNVKFPIYSRKLHNPVADQIIVNKKNVLLLLEGNWVFSDFPGWPPIAKLLDYKIYITSDKEINRERIIRRHMLGGRTLPEAQDHYHRSDKINFDLIEKSKSVADWIISL